MKKRSLKEVRAKLDEYIAKVIELEQELKDLEHCRYYRVSIWGSKRMTFESKYGQITYQIAKRLAWEGIDIVTGGGPGLMEAATRGAKEGQREAQSKAKAVGLHIQGGYASNSYLDIKRTHPKFTSRLEEFFRMSMVFIVMPGGIGTLLELFYAWQLLQEFSKTKQPMILVGTEFWRGLLDWMRNSPLALG
ncbi:MAG: LOG family protein, partial [Leptospiraceae bacterium]|nr:LOG family protein [Leptospiraceae bacterium]